MFDGLKARTYAIIPFVEQPCFILNGTNVYKENLNIPISENPRQGYVTTRNAIPVTLKKNSNTSFMLPNWTLFEHTCSNISNTDSSCMQPIIQYRSKSADFYHNFINIELNETKTYSVGVQLCTPISCSELKSSKSFVLEHAITSALITKNEIVHESNDNVTINISWKPFSAVSGITLYQWVLSKDNDANQVIGSWKTIINTGQTTILAAESIHLPVHPHSTLYICVRAFSNAGNSKTMCKIGTYISTGMHDQNVVYDLDASAPAWNKILDMIHSSNLGDRGVDLHDSELDFGTKQTKVAGAMLYATQRNVTWYLMTSRRIPMFDECLKDTECITSQSNSDGYILFDSNNLISNKLYFTCALSEEINIARESFIENVAEIRSCSDGFILDSDAPSGGQVHIENTEGFLNDINDVRITWGRFSDNIDTTVLGYDETIKFYSYAIGSSTTSTDIRNFTNIGLSRSVIEGIDSIQDGTAVFVFVKGTDQAGLSTIVRSKEFVVDTSLPTTGHIIINNKPSSQSFVTSDVIDLYLTDFIDAESGIDHFEICLETHPRTCDISNMTSFDENYIQYMLPEHLHDGNIYSLSGRAINRAGLKSGIITRKFIKDVSPPTGGHVIDGHWSLQHDEDYQKEIDVIAGHWRGFSDSHSGVQYYRVGLGSQPLRFDIEPMIDVFLKTDVSWNGTFVPGKRYYITVEACNGAGLCTSLTSDGIILDNSPPINGIVKIGSEGSRLKYIAQRTSLHIQWTGFEDPQSEIEHYEYCVGKQPYSCDIFPLSSSLLQSNVIITSISLPFGIDLYVMVTAVNLAGLSVKQTSDSFKVDDTPPKLIKRPMFVLENDTELVKSVHWDKSLLRITWKFVDPESPIVQHTIALKTHHEGHTPVENIVIGNTDTFIINLDKDNWLHDGDSYFVTVTSCNRAGLCSSARSKRLLIDSSPPHMGGFMTPMNWVNCLDSENNSQANVSLRWYGFDDPDSAIDKFYITVSRSYSGDELTEGCAIINVKELLEPNFTIVTLEDSVTPSDAIILTIWAENAAGLNSSASRVTVWPLSHKNENMKIQSGSLELEKHSCDSHFCSGDCTCSVIGKSCRITDCNFINSTTVIALHLPQVDVYSGLGSLSQIMTASSACLSGHWETVDGDDALIMRYEWNIRLVGEEAGAGIFDPSEKQWRDVGKRTELIHCLPLKSGLIHAMQYKIYIKAWYSKTDFAIFNSPAIVVDHTPPQKAKGKNVIDSDHKCAIDYDVIDWMDEVTFCWKRVFRETQSNISHYSVSLGTSINGSEVFENTDVGLATNITLKNMNFTHGTKYYFNVIAYNTLGMQNSLSSDGFVIDMDTPIAGVVHNTDRYFNKGFQSSASTFGISWHGFVDNFSGVKTYHVAICEGNVTDTSNLTFTNVGLKTSHLFTNVELQHGRAYLGLVKALDSAGHSSAVSKSDLKRVDLTPPLGLLCDKYNLKQRSKTSIESNRSVYESSYNSIKFMADLKKDNLYKLTGLISGSNSLSKVLIRIDRFEIKLPTTRTHNGSQEFKYKFISPTTKTDIIEISEVIIEGRRRSIYVDLYDCVEHTLPTRSNYDFMKIQQIGPSTLAVSAMVYDLESSIYKVKFGLGTTKRGLQIKPFAPIIYGTESVMDIQAEHGSSVHLTVIAENHAGLSSSFYSNPITFDKTPPTITKLQVTLSSDNTKDAVYDIHAMWKAEDLESGIKMCFCGLAKMYHMNGTEKPIRTKTTESCEFKNMTFRHGDSIIVKVLCVNNVELSKELDSNTVIVSKYPPSIEHAELNVVSAVQCKRGFTLSGRNVTDGYVQYNMSRVEIEWSGFEDSSYIESYEYRIRHESRSIVEWTSARRHTMATIYGLSLNSGELYAIDVRAKNSGQYISESVTATLLTYSQEPKLTGKAMAVTQSHRSISIDWKEVFEIPSFEYVVYDVTIGSRRGFSDVIQYQRVEFQHCLIPIPDSSTVSDKINELFVVISCIYSSGVTAQYEINYKM